VLLDQLTKVWAVAALSDSPIDIFGEVLQFRLTRNPGAAFSSFTTGGPVLGVIAAAVAVVIAALLPRIDLGIDRFALALIMGGALGNLTDRIFRGAGFLDGAVVDFISPSFFPSFNVADSAITIGVALMLWSSIFNQEQHEAAAAARKTVASAVDQDLS
jgi:signal peptidase II